MRNSQELTSNFIELIEDRVRILTESARRHRAFVTAPINVTLGEPPILPYVVNELRRSGVFVSALTTEGGSVNLYARERVGGIDLIVSGQDKPIQPEEFEQLFNVANYYIRLMTSSD